MITVQITALDASGRSLGFALGMGLTLARAKHAAGAGMSARLRNDAAMAGRVRTFTVEAI